GIVRSLGDGLREAGLEAVEQREVPVAVGDWGGRAGSLNASNLRSLFARLAGPIETRLGVSAAEQGELVQAMRVEWEERHSMCSYTFAFGRRPSAPAKSAG
ncbi:MAG TPA: hypothetical protein VIC57_17325, partial [Candidatus Dormibacteraeota bacterium]